MATQHAARRIGWSGVVAGAVLLASAGGAALAQGSLFPTGTGSTWTYSGHAGPQQITMTAEIVSAKRAGSGTEAVERWSMGGRVTQEETYLVTATSVSRSRSGPNGAMALTPPVPVIKYPMTAGKTWTWSGSIGNGIQSYKGNATLKVKGQEDVRVGTRSLKAWRVDMNLTISGKDLKGQQQRVQIPNTYWFAPGVGLVKQKVTLANGTNSAVIEATATDYKIR